MNATMSEQKTTYKKRHVLTCKACGKRFRAARPEALYCDDACSQAAYRERKAERAAEQARIEAARIEAERATQARIEAEAERRRKAERAVERAAIEAERQRTEAARLEAERVRAVEAQAERAAEQARKQQLIKPCECGGKYWRIKKQGLLTPRFSLSCANCGAERPYQWPKAIYCPNCAYRTHETLLIDNAGNVACKVCGHVVRHVNQYK